MQALVHLLKAFSPTRLLRPGQSLMLALPMRTKLVIVAILVSLPMALLATWSLVQVRAKLRGVQLEKQGLVVLDRVSALSVALQQHRVLTQRLLVGVAETTAPRAEVRRAIDAGVVDITGLLQSGPALQLMGEWQAVQQRVQAALADGAGATGGVDSLAKQADALDALRQLARLTAERSGLLLDSHASSYLPLELATAHLAPLMDSTARATAVGVAALDAREEGVSPAERTQLLSLASRIDQQLREGQVVADALDRAGLPPMVTWKAASAASDGFAIELRDVFANERPELAAAALAAAGREVLMQQQQTLAESFQRSALALDETTGRLMRQLVFMLSTFVVGGLLTAYLFLALYRTFMSSITSLQRSTAAVAEGDLSTHLDLPGRDELSHIGRTVNGMNERLSSLVAEIRSSAARVNMAGNQVAEGSQRLSQRTEEQASNLRESVVAITQLSSDVQHNAQAARELDSVAEQLARQAGEGHQAMTETISAVAQLQESSRRVFEVVSVIDDVAFQTGMLSLNAAVEAARAGEAGKGFSVVASEVRQLAQRVGDSAEEIRSLITQASDQLQFSGEKLGSANQALESVVSGVQGVSDRLREISQASTSQSEVLVGVAARVGDLDQITRDNARLVDESTAASHSLLERAQVLRDAVSSMRLRQGSADEAHALVDRALSHIAAVGTEQGLKDLHEPALGFIDRDLYVFALDRDGVYIACGAKAQNVGTSVNSLPGIEGTPFVQNVWAAAEAGGGWVQYEIANPLTGEVTPKESFVVQLDANLVLGCGIYRKAGADPGKVKAAAWSRTQESAHVQSY